MKKTLVVTALACLCLFSAKAQLAGTKWKGIVYLYSSDTTQTPPPTVISWDFKKDTVKVLFPGGEEEVMTYKVSDKMIAFTKISGGSPCDAGTVGQYSFMIKEDKLTFYAVNEPCPVRGKSANGRSFDRIKE